MLIFFLPSSKLAQNLNQAEPSGQKYQKLQQIGLGKVHFDGKQNNHA